MKLSKIGISTAVLIAILLAAFVLRVWGASFGLPFVYHPDEGFEVNRALQLGTGEFDFNFFRMVKGGYFYLSVCRVWLPVRDNEGVRICQFDD